MSSPKAKREIAVFIASPGDLREERKQFKIAIEDLNSGFAQGARVHFEALGWEETLATTGPRSQEVINQEVDRCDVFFLIMHRRWGQPAPDAKPYDSYTEEEYYRAYKRWEKTGSPSIFVFFKRVEAAQEADAGPQLKKVIAFRKRLEKTRKVLYRTIEDRKNAFLDEVDKHLKAYALDELPKADRPREHLELPESEIEEMDRLREDMKAAQSEKEARELEIAEDAAKFALEGFLEHAREKFVNLIGNTANIQILKLAETFFTRTGDLETSLDILKRWLALAEPGSADLAEVLMRRGNIHRIKGEWDDAEMMYKKSLAVGRALDRKKSMAANYNNLGLVYESRGEWDKALGLHEKSLAIKEALGEKEGMAINYTNLGIVHQKRGKWDDAESMYEKALAIDEAVENKQGMAANYTHLGIIYAVREEWDDAIEMYEKALVINKTLGRKQGMAINYTNLGIVHEIRKGWNDAEAMSKKALEIYKALGNMEGLASNYTHLGNVHLNREEWDDAIGMYERALAINESLGRKEGMAINYANLGILHQTRGKRGLAKNHWLKSLQLYESLGSPKAKEIKKWLEDEP